MDANARWKKAEYLLAQRRPEQAIWQLEENLKADPSHVPSLLTLSEVLTRKGRHRRPRQLAEMAYAARPTQAPLIYGVAQKLRRFHRYEKLVGCLSNVNFSKGAPSTILAEAAVMLSFIGANEEAWNLIGSALAREPNNAAALYFRGNLHTFNGSYEHARDDYEACLHADERMFQAAWMLSGLRTATDQDNQIDRLRVQAEQATPGRKGESYVRFALFKELDDLGQHDEAWLHLERGLRVERANTRYSAEAHKLLIHGLIKKCSVRFLEDRSQVRLERRPIFIIGMFRSGTTLLEQMLSGNPAISVGGESYAFTEEVKNAADCEFPGVVDQALLDQYDHIDIDLVAREYAKNATWLARDKAVFTEKLPTNYLNVGLIYRALPQAKVIHLVREPMDTCFANLKTLFSGLAGYSYNQRELAAYYLDYRRIMAHWHSVIPGFVLDVNYAELVSNPSLELKRICSFCSIPFDEAMLDLGRKSRAVVTASAAQVRGGIMLGRRRAWEPYAEKLAELRSFII